MVAVARVYVEREQVPVAAAGLVGDAVVGIHGPFLVAEVVYLHAGGCVVEERSVAGVELSVDDTHEAEVVVFGSARLQTAYLCQQRRVDGLILFGVVAHVGPVGWVHEIVGEQSAVQSVGVACSIEIVALNVAVHDVEAQLIRVLELTVGYVDADDAKGCGEIGVSPCHIDAVDGLFLSHRRVHISRHVGDVAVG